jgi:hypothetical protein
MDLCTANKFYDQVEFHLKIADHVEEIQCEYFKNAIDDAEIWGAESVIKACGFLAFREDFEIIFLLKGFSDVFSCTDVLFNLLQTNEFTSCNETRKQKKLKFTLIVRDTPLTFQYGLMLYHRKIRMNNTNDVTTLH